MLTRAAVAHAAGKPLVIGTPTGSLQHAKLAIYLKSAGVDPEKDVQIANIPFPNHPRALEAGDSNYVTGVGKLCPVETR